MIRNQVAEIHGVSLDEDWWYVNAPAGQGWCSQQYLTIEDTFEPDPAWPAVPHGKDAIFDTFGQPGSAVASAGRVTFPKPMKLGWKDQYITAFACHKLIEDPLSSVFREIAKRDGVQYLETFDGCYNDRTITNRQKISTHAWGIAIDLNASKNPFGRTPTMHPLIIGIFKDHGFTWGGDWNRPDGMHFQFASGY